MPGALTQSAPFAAAAKLAAVGCGNWPSLFWALVSNDLVVSEYTALQLKKAIVGHGHAKKHQVQEMVMRLLKLPGLPGKDAADALGLAITHAHAGGSLAAMAKATQLAPRAHAQYRRGRTY